MEPDNVSDSISGGHCVYITTAPLEADPSPLLFTPTSCPWSRTSSTASATCTWTSASRPRRRGSPRCEWGAAISHQMAAITQPRSSAASAKCRERHAEGAPYSPDLGLRCECSPGSPSRERRSWPQDRRPVRPLPRARQRVLRASGSSGIPRLEHFQQLGHDAGWWRRGSNDYLGGPGLRRTEAARLGLPLPGPLDQIARARREAFSSFARTVPHVPCRIGHLSRLSQRIREFGGAGQKGQRQNEEDAHRSDATRPSVICCSCRSCTLWSLCRSCQFGPSPFRICGLRACSDAPARPPAPCPECHPRSPQGHLAACSFPLDRAEIHQEVWRTRVQIRREEEASKAGHVLSNLRDGGWGKRWLEKSTGVLQSLRMVIHDLTRIYAEAGA